MTAASSGMCSCLQVAEQHAVLLLERQQGYTEVQIRLAGDLRSVPPAPCAAEHVAPMLLASNAQARFIFA